MEHEAGVEPACFGVKTQRGYRQPTARVRLIWIRRQESNLRGLRSERSWDTDNPHLSNLAGRHGLEPCKAGFGDQPPPCGRPRVGGAHCCRHRYPCGYDAVSGRSRVSLGLRSRMAEGGGHDPHTRQGASGFRGRDEPMLVSPSKMADGGRSRSTYRCRYQPGSSRRRTPCASPSRIGGEQ